MKLTHWPPGGEDTKYHWCPACDRLHVIPCSGWTRSGPDHMPSYQPSFLQHNGHPNGKCHYLITAGRIQFCPDSWHRRNDTVAMPIFPRKCSRASRTPSLIAEGRMRATSFSQLVKDMTAASVHVPTALGNEDDDGKKPGKNAISVAYLQKRQLQPHVDGTSKSPFVYDPNALANIRPDQAPRFFGALTDPGTAPVQRVKLADLHAMQDRVDGTKAEAMARDGVAGGKLPVVVRMRGKDYIADGHHRLTAEWLKGADEADVHYKDLEPVSQALKREPSDWVNVHIAKIDEGLGLVFGFAIVCKVDGQDYYDLNVDQDGPHAGERVPEHITEKAMTEAALDFSDSARPGNEMHDGPDKGQYVFLFPLSTDIAKAMGIQTRRTGLLCAYRPPADVLQKFKDGTYTGFSIEGRRLAVREHE